MSRNLAIRYFAHSWISDWNHGNAHFLRGLARALVRRGHDVRCYEQLGAWSLTNLVQLEHQRATGAIEEFRQKFPELDVRFYNNDSRFRRIVREELRGADVVVLHEWNEPEVVNSILSLKKELGFRALFHDTHHRAYTNAGEILRFHLHEVDGVLAFGDAIRRIYADGFGVARAWTFHEAADVGSFAPLDLPKDNDVVWIGNWGDEERTRELEEFLIAPAAAMRERKFVVHGVRYPQAGLEKLAHAGIEYRGYLPNLSSPEVYGRSRIGLHVPRRQYTNGLSGIPTIRVFEALACGIPLLCSPWMDIEGLFRPGQDYAIAADGNAMKAEIENLLKDDAARRQMSDNGLATIRARHTCDHRAEQLLDICEELN
ncbi:MAG TPA: glycosyltransferase [Terriglobales bacterium]|nr:glycosyltransferase [Terriglobales bacterium]